MVLLSIQYVIMEKNPVKEECMKEYLSIREMVLADIDILSESFMAQGWPGRKEILRKYFHEQEETPVCFLLTSLSHNLHIIKFISTCSWLDFVK